MTIDNVTNTKAKKKAPVHRVQRQLTFNCNEANCIKKKKKKKHTHSQEFTN